MQDQNNETLEIDWQKIYTDKANEIKDLLSGLSQQDIENVLSIFKQLLPSNLYLVLPPLVK
jgi:hypothetical protein